MRVDTPTLSLCFYEVFHISAWIDSSMVHKSVDYLIFILRFRYQGNFHSGREYKVIYHLQERIQSFLSKAVIISADIWSKPGMTESFLGATAYFTPDSDKRHSICLALRRYLSPHTGVNIAELLQGLLMSGKYHVKNYLEFLLTIEAT